MTMSPLTVMSPSLPRVTARNNRPAVCFAASNSSPDVSGSSDKKIPFWHWPVALGAGLMMSLAAIYTHTGELSIPGFSAIPKFEPPILKAPSLAEETTTYSLRDFQALLEQPLAGPLSDVALMHDREGTKIIHFKLAGEPNVQFSYTTVGNDVMLKRRELDPKGKKEIWGVATTEGKTEYFYELRTATSGKKSEEEGRSSHPNKVEYMQNVLNTLQQRLNEQLAQPKEDPQPKKGKPQPAPIRGVRTMMA